MAAKVSARSFRDEYAVALMNVAGCKIEGHRENACATHKTAAPEGMCLSVLSAINQGLVAMKRDIQNSLELNEFERIELTLEN